MMNKEWEDFFGIEEVYDTTDAAIDNFTGAKKDAVAALASCINTNGCVDLGWMMDASGLAFDELTEVLEGAIYQDPEVYDIYHADDQGWMLRAQYLSGNIKTKLEMAKELNSKYNGRFEANVDALKAAMPAKVDFDVIGFGLGSPWIPEKYYSLFAKEVLGLFCLPEIHYSTALGRWKIVISPKARNAVQNIYTYGTKRLTALQIMETTLNGGTVKVYDEVSRPERKSGVAKVLNKVETLAAQEKQELLQNVFQEWVRKDPSCVKRMKEIFYDTYACNVSGRYSGSFLELPDLDIEHFTPYPHQKDAVARIILEKDVLLNHKVGTGKTGIIIMGVHERKRIGLSDKNLIVVPNNVLEAFERAHRELYPQDNILVVHPEDFKPDCRQEVLTKIKDGDYVAVYMAFSSFERLGMSKAYKIEQQREQIRTCRAQAANASETWERSRLEAIASHLSEELMKMQEEIPADEFTTFDELCITTLVIDEAHNYKNVSIDAHADGVVGMHAKGSKKCDEMLEKVQYVRMQGGGIIFSTGTPLTNFISDLFVLQMFLQPEQLELLHLNHFDEWINNFATRQTGFEVDVDSQNYRVRTRFNSFHNVPELTSLFAGVCDFYSNDDGGMDLPESEGYTDVIVEKSIEQEIYIDDLVDRTEKIRQKHVRGTEDNLLKVTHDGRAAALDIRLADPTAEPDPDSTKAHACAEKVYELWMAYPDTAQLVFCDLGTPKKGFNVYDELKKRLKEMGISASQIAFVHDATTDARRRKLFEAVNNASVRVLIGSTSKLGTGVNVQERLVAIHHLDIPWKPSDIVQREGRLIRQGNTNDKVFRFRYITAGTFDAYSWQLLENKQRFISQIMTSKSPVRSCEDVDEQALSYAEIKALCAGNPLIKEKMDLDVQVAKLRVLKADHQSQKFRLQDKLLTKFPADIQETNAHIAGLKADAQLAAAHPQGKEEFCGMTIRGVTYDEKKTAGERLVLACSELPNAEEKVIGSYRGFELSLRFDTFRTEYQALLKGQRKYTVPLGTDPLGNIIRLDNSLNNFPERITAAENELDTLHQQQAAAQIEVEKPFPQEEELAEKSARLAELNAQLDVDEKSHEPEQDEEEQEDAPRRPSVLAALEEKSDKPEPVKPFRSYYDKDGDAR